MQLCRETTGYGAKNVKASSATTVSNPTVKGRHLRMHGEHRRHLKARDRDLPRDNKGTYGVGHGNRHPGSVSERFGVARSSSTRSGRQLGGALGVAATSGNLSVGVDGVTGASVATRTTVGA